MPAKVYTDKDADLGVFKNKTLAVLGYGSQGHAHALNLKDSGCKVIIGLYAKSQSREVAKEYGFEVMDTADAVKAAGVPIYTHTCGSIGDRLELMVETGTQGIDTLDPPPLGNTILAEAKAQIGDRVFIKGNMNAVELLAAKTKEAVIAHATDRLLTGMPGGGYILSTACSVAPRMEPWKLELLVPLAEKLGRYQG